MALNDDRDSNTDDTPQSRFPAYAKPLVSEALDKASILASDPDADVLHKLRVALRRLRSLLWAYRPLFNGKFDPGQLEVLKDLAGAAGKTRDWDILIELMQGRVESKFTLDKLSTARASAVEESRQILAREDIQTVLDDVVKSSLDALSKHPVDVSLPKFARQRVDLAERSLKKRMRRAHRSKRSDYASFHEVRKAAKKVRYLLEFFEPLLGKKQLKMMRMLKKVQKRFGALNDVVASEQLLHRNRKIFNGSTSVDVALASLEKERKQRVRAAARLL